MTRFLTLLAGATGLAAASFASTAHADVFSVPADFPTIQAAIDAASDGDSIRVAPGVYNEQLTIDKWLLIRADDPEAGVCVLDGTGLAGGSTVTFGQNATNSDFRDFTLRDGFDTLWGGAMYIGSNVLIKDCVFEDNQSTTYGGAITADLAEPLIIDCTFLNNEGGAGGAVYIGTGEAGAEITGCTFIGNSADSGGAIHVLGTAGAQIYECTFESNTALRGGGLRVLSGQATVQWCTFTGNTATMEGGGVFFSNADQSVIEDCTLTGNTADRGGGFASDFGTVGVQMADCEVVGNVATSGGGVRAGGMTITSSTIEDNVADFGAGLHAFHGVTVINGGAIRNNVAGIDGGGVWVDDALTMIGGAVHGNHADDDGGGVGGSGGSDVTLSRVRIYDNTADDNGGGLFLENDADVVNCLVFGNAAGDQGGGVYTSDFNGGVPRITNTTIYANDAADGASGLTALGGQSDIRNCVIWGNTGTNVGPVGQPNVTYSVVQGGFAGVGNIADDPNFVDPVGQDGVVGTIDDDLRLGPFSPAIDGGDNGAPGLGGVTTDFDSLPRFYDDGDQPDNGAGAAPIVDMGAHERQINSAAQIVTIDDDDSIQATIDSVPSGSVIILEEGFYNQSFNPNGKAITIRSTDPSDPDTVRFTRIQPPAPGVRMVTINANEGPDTVISGLTLQLGDAEKGAAMNIAGGASPTIHACVFDRNESTDDGGAVRIGGVGTNPTFVNCGFYANVAAEQGGAAFIASAAVPSFINCVFVDNTALSGGAMSGGVADPIILNCTFFKNEAADTGGAYRRSGSGQPKITNSIFWQNTPDQFNTSTGDFVTYCIVEGGYPGVGNLDADPMFDDPNGANNNLGTPDDDLSLKPFSPAIDAGNNEAAELVGVVIDFLGNDRFYDDIDVVDSGNGAAPVIDIGAYENEVPSAPQIVEVFPGDSIQAAIDAVAEGSEVVVGPGVYAETFNTRGKAITVRSQNPIDPGVVAATILDGEGVRRLIICDTDENPDTVVEGFTIRNGFGNLGGAVWCNFNAKPTMRWCSFINNHSTLDGGAVSTNNTSGPRFFNCAFIGNTADRDGGAVEHNNADTTFVNCLFTGNIAGDNGGAVYAGGGSDDDVINCTFVNNIAGVTGGAFGRNGASEPTIVNSILWGNLPDEIETQDNPAIVTYSIVAGGFPGEGNLDADPFFVDADGADDTPGTADDDARLSPASPAIEVGLNEGVPVDVILDLDANERFFDADGDRLATVDLGAYERQDLIGCAGDFDRDGVVDASDLAVLLAAWGSCDDCPADLNGDGFVGASDLAALLANWGSCD